MWFSSTTKALVSQISTYKVSLMLNAHEMAQSMQCLLYKHEGQDSDLKSTQEKVGITEHWRGGQIHVDPCSSCLGLTVNAVSSMFSWASCLKRQGRK